MNARARREGDKVRQAVVKNQLTNWASFKMKNFDPCTNKGKEYKELFIVEGNSAKGGLKSARDPRYQALFAIRGVSLNVYKVSPEQIVGQNGNKEFTDLVSVLGCNVGAKFDLDKLNYDKIIIATDADIDGYFIRSLLLAFFFRMMPDVIADGRLYIAEPPLYRIDDKKDPFVTNKQEYNDRYMRISSKDFKIGYRTSEKSIDVDYMDNKRLLEFLSETQNYANNMMLYAEHFKINDRLLEMILEEMASNEYNRHRSIIDQIKQVNMRKLEKRIQETFNEIYYDDNDGCFHGIINHVMQLREISEGLIRKCEDEIEILEKWQPSKNGSLVLHDKKTGVDHDLSLLEALIIPTS